MFSFWSRDRLLILVAATWLTLFTQLPGVHCSVLVFAGTALLIAINVGVSLRALTQWRQALLGLNCVQIVLFGLLNYQLYCAFGAGHYRCDREPCFYDWIEFTAAHVLRAADVLDALDEYGVPLQNIMHDSIASGIVLVLMHLTVDVFLIGLIVRWASRYWPDDKHETRLARGRREFGWLLATLGLYFAFVVLARLRPSDWILWPLDNLLRLLDVGDMFQLFGWKLHGVESNFVTNTAGVLFRLAASIWVAKRVNWLRLRLMRTWGVSIDELIELLDDLNPDVRRGAALGLGESGPLAWRAARPLLAALHDIDPKVRCESARALGRIGPVAHLAVPDLLDAVWRGHHELRLAAIEALGGIGWAARSAAYSLLTLKKVEDRPTCAVINAALQKIAPELLKVLPPMNCNKHRRRFSVRAGPRER